MCPLSFKLVDIGCIEDKLSICLDFSRSLYFPEMEEDDDAAVVEGATTTSPKMITGVVMNGLRDQLYKIGLPGKLILGDHLQENRTSQRR